MDMAKMGTFLADLRKEQKLTQAELGEKLGVTNKTISRWETGSYMPPVEMLEELSRMYDLTINELLSGKKLSEEEYKEMAETNIKETLSNSSFSLKEKQEFYKKKWLKDHSTAERFFHPQQICLNRFSKSYSCFYYNHHLRFHKAHKYNHISLA